MFNRTNRTLSAKNARLNLGTGTRSFAVVTTTVNANVSGQTLRLRRVHLDRLHDTERARILSIPPIEPKPDGMAMPMSFRSGNLRSVAVVRIPGSTSSASRPQWPSRSYSGQQRQPYPLGMVGQVGTAVVRPVVARKRSAAGCWRQAGTLPAGAAPAAVRARAALG